MNEIEREYLEEETINLLDLLMIIIRHKLLIIFIVFFSGLAAVLISLRMTNIYRSEATIIIRDEEEAGFNPLASIGGLGGVMADGLGFGGGGSLDKIKAVLNSRNLTTRVIEKYKLMPVVFSDVWNQEKKTWETSDPPTLQDGCKAMESLLSIKSDIKNNTIQVGFDHHNPEIAKKVVDYYLTELSEVLREEVLQDASEKKRFFREQLEKTIDTLLKDKIYSMLAREIEKETFAKVQKYYSFLVLDPPIIPDKDKQVSPKRALICILSVIVSFFVAVFLAFIIEYINGLKTTDQERYQNLVQELSFRKKRPRTDDADKL